MQAPLQHQSRKMIQRKWMNNLKISDTCHQNLHIILHHKDTCHQCEEEVNHPTYLNHVKQLICLNLFNRRNHQEVIQVGSLRDIMRNSIHQRSEKW